jgi:hypothetical protein
MSTAEQGPEDRAAGRLAWLWLAGAAAALVLYVLTLAPDLVWQDAGDYQWQAAQFNLVRPGDAVRVHPWFLVVAYALGRIPLWNYAYAANLASAIGTALAVANVLLLARLVTGRTWPAILAATTFAVGHAVWSYATVAQTYGWMAAFLTAMCLAAYAYLAERKVRWLLAAFLAGGLGLSDHLLLGIALVVLAGWTAWEVLRRRAPWWVLPAAAGCSLAGASLYGAVLALEYMQTGSLAETLRSALVGRWAAGVFNLADLPVLLGKSVLYIGLAYPTPLALAGFTGAVALVRRRDAFSRLLLVLAVVYLVWAVRYKVSDPEAFFIPFYVFASVMIGVGAARFLDGRGRWAAAALAVAAILPVAVYAVLPRAAEGLLAACPEVRQRLDLATFERPLPYRDTYVYLFQPWKCGDRSARRFAQEVLRSLPPHAVLLPDSTASPPLVCLQRLEGLRRDVLIAGAETAMTSYIGRHFWLSDRDLATDAADQNLRIFVVSNHPRYVPRWVAKYARLEPFGIVWEVRPRAEGAAP